MNRYEINLPDDVICSNWWSKNWCKAIEKYAEYVSRLKRGRHYLRNSYIKELAIDGSKVVSKVAGIHTPGHYGVFIAFDPMTDQSALDCLRSTSLLKHLDEGIVPDDCNLFDADSPLFPSIDEIHFACDCPDIASPCKHLCAVLYAIGSIIDVAPLVMLQLRGIDIDGIRAEISKDNESEIDKYLAAQGEAGGHKVVDAELLSELFGINLSKPPASSAKRKAKKAAKRPAAIKITIYKKDGRKRRMAQKPAPKKQEPAVDPLVIRQYRMDGTFVAQYDSAREAEEATRVSAQSINFACSGKQKTAGDYQWRRRLASQSISSIEPVTINNYKPKRVCQLDLNRELMYIFPSINEASRQTGVNAKSIRQALSGKQGTAGDFYWEYAQD